MGKLSHPALTALTVLAALLLALAGCGGDDDGAGQPTSAKGGGAPDANVAKAQKLVEEAAAVPDFEAPGPAFDATKAKGKLIFSVPLNSSIPTAELKKRTYEKLADQVGFRFVVHPNQGQPSDWVQGMNAAIARKADLIMLDGAPNPKLLGPQIKEATDAGIPVLVTHFHDESATKPDDVTAIVPAPFNRAAQLEANWIVADSGGNANVLVVQSAEAPPSAGSVKTIQDEFAALCPDTCKATVIDVPVTDWATKTQGEVQSALVKNPELNYVLPLFDGMVQFAVAGVTAGGAANDVKIVSFNGTPSVLQMIQDGSPVAMDVGENPEWLAYANLDQALRILVGQEPVASENTPARVFTADNVDEAGTPPQLGQGYGDAYVAGYEQLWGLK
jgi:ribose transport system substrate-binding protein